jgi:DNA-binding SARP family transcriptional activator/tetratricopeptide (TPR) repeat protein
MAGQFEVLLLGGVEVLDGGAPVAVTGAKLKAIVAMLAMAAPHPVSDDRLIDELWGDEQPANPANALQGQVSHLRRLLGRDGVERRGPGYVLAVGPDDVDTIRLERLVRAGRDAATAADHAGAIDGFGSALQLVRGPPLDDLGEFRFARRAATRLEELVVAAHEGLADSMLATGRHAEVVSTMAGLVQSHPMRERFHAQLILALYRSGRQAEALRAYQDARNQLVEELGVDPGPELRALEQAVLSQDPSLAAPVAAAAPAAPVPSTDRAPEPAVIGRRPLFGRDEELGLLREEFARACSGQVRVVLLGGEPGIGKTRLAEEITADATAQGLPVAWGRCYEGRGAPAHWPWIQVMNSVLARVDDDTMRRSVATGAAELAQIVPEIKELVPGLDPPSPVDPATAQFRLFQAYLGFLRRTAATQPLLVVLDDLHWGDAPSLELLTTIATELWDVPILIVGTYRNVDPSIGGALASALVDLSRRSSVQRVEVDGLDREGLAAMMAAGGEAPTDDVVLSVYRRTQGNPFFVSELLQLLQHGVSTDAERVSHAVPAGVKGVIRQRFARLPDDTRDTITVAATLGQDFDLAVLAATIDAEGATLLDHLEPALDAGIVVDNIEGNTRYRFSHGLVNETIYDDLGVGQRARVHGRIAEALEAHHGATGGPHLFAIAEHWFHAVPAAPADKGIDASLRAAQWAQTHVAHRQAIDQLHAGLQLIAAMPDDRHRAMRELEVQDHLSQLLIAATSYTDPEFGRACARIRELCDKVGEEDLLVPAMWRLSVHHMMCADIDSGIDLGEQLLDLAVDETSSSKLAGHITLGCIYFQSGDTSGAASHFAHAIAMCDAGHDAALRRSVTEEPAVFSRMFKSLNTWLQGDEERAQQEADEAIAIALRSGRDTWSTMVAHWAASTVSMLRCDTARTIEICDEGIELAIAGGYGLGIPYMGANRGWAIAAIGDVEVGEAQLLEGAGVADAFGAVYMKHVFHGMHADVCLMSERYADALTSVDEGLRAVESTGERWYEAELHRLRGEALRGIDAGDPEATAAFRRAIAVAGTQGADALAARAEASLAAMTH